MYRTTPHALSLALILFVFAAGPASAQAPDPEGVYYVQALSEVDWDEANDPQFPVDRRVGSLSDPDLWARVVLDQPGEACLQMAPLRFRSAATARGGEDEDINLAIRIGAPADVSGTVWFSTGRNRPLQPFRFKVSADQFTADRDQFLAAQQARYQRLLSARFPGAAWFRFRTNQLADELNQQPLAGERAAEGRWQNERDIERSFSLISGGRAVSENLQLDRVLEFGTGDDRELVDINAIEGITVSEFNWDPLVKDIDPQLDKTARCIPADQHAVFVPDFESMVTLIEQGFSEAGPLLPLWSGSGESADTLSRYQMQLGLPLGNLQKMLGPRLINSLALTGGDPYFRTGTDVAVILEATDPVALGAALAATITAAAGGQPGAEPVSGDINGTEYQGYQSPDRRICSYRTQLGDMLVVTNSLAQLERIVEAFHGETPALASLDEYRFFRDRYPLWADTETALVVITDATIRRWCSPRWRIATSRRTRAAAVLSELHARYLRQLADGVTEPTEIEIGPSAFSLDRFTLAGNSVISDRWGTLEFLTPISELDIERVSQREQAGYETWRRGYESGWNQAFDPIAMRVRMDPQVVAADLTVLPLIANSDYSQMVDVSAGAKLDSRRNSRHPEAIAWLALALNTESDTLKMLGNFAVMFTRVNFLDWLGDAAVVFVDEDPLWVEMLEQEGDGGSAEDFVEGNLHRLPIAVQFNVRSSVHLTAFLVGLRGYIEQSAPDMTTWETRRHQDQAYVKIGLTADARGTLPADMSEDIGLYYLASGDTLIFSLSEPLIQRAIERKQNRDAGAADEPADDSQPILGDHLAVQIKSSLARGLLTLLDAGYQQQMQRQAWAPIPVMNEWRSMFPDRGPAEIERVVWKRQFVCPGGGEYRWNDKWQTMESTVYGHPGNPQPGPPAGRLLEAWALGNFGLTFEHDGLRARIQLYRSEPPQAAAAPGQ